MEEIKAGNELRKEGIYLVSDSYCHLAVGYLTYKDVQSKVFPSSQT